MTATYEHFEIYRPDAGWRRVFAKRGRKWVHYFSPLHTLDGRVTVKKWDEDFQPIPMDFDTAYVKKTLENLKRSRGLKSYEAELLDQLEVD